MFEKSIYLEARARVVIALSWFRFIQSHAGYESRAELFDRAYYAQAVLYVRVLLYFL